MCTQQFCNKLITNSSIRSDIEYLVKEDTLDGRKRAIRGARWARVESRESGMRAFDRARLRGETGIIA